MPSLPDLLLPSLRALPAPPLPSAQDEEVREWGRLLCEGLRGFQPHPSDSTPDEREEWRELLPWLVKSRWPDFPWDRLPWRARELRALWYQVRNCAIEGPPVDVMSPDYPLPPSVLLGGRPLYLDPSHAFGEQLQDRRVVLSSGACPRLDHVSFFHPQAPFWEHNSRVGLPNTLSRADAERNDGGGSGAWADLSRAWLMHQVLTGSLRPGAYKLTERDCPVEDAKSLCLSFSVRDEHAPGFVTDLLGHFFPREQGAGALSAFHPGIMIHVNGSYPVREGASPQALALRQWAQTLAGLSSFPRFCKLTFWVSEAVRADPAWGLLQEVCREASLRLGLHWSSVGYSEWFLCSPRLVHD